MNEFLSLLKARDFKALFQSKTDNGLILFLRYIPVGGAATVSDWAVLFLLHDIFNLNLYLAAALSFIAGLLTNYFLSVIFVFKKHSDNMGKVAEFIAFGLTGLIGLGLTELLMLLFEGVFDWHYMISKIIITGIVFIWNFASKKIIICGKGASK